MPKVTPKELAELDSVPTLSCQFITKDDVIISDDDYKKHFKKNSKNKTIYKYELIKFNKWFQMLIPKKAKFLSVQEQKGKIVLWCEVNKKAGKEIKDFILVGTGIDFNRDSHYIGTVQSQGVVWHLYTRA